ncbi:hypothetical protein COY91_03625 [Candidatus Shapirobacteria bacterium CG_4_10_14_0_8_um_filter_39_15]|nr:MAG: hypothetical protein COY91_03625 [Candidatus Shapirobacteria bacterium CG_4_10_14_0_8_um_filter_39_15]
MDPQPTQPPVNLVQPENTPVSPVPVSSKKPKIFLLLVILFLVIFIIIGYFGFKSLKTDISCGGFMGTICPRGYFCLKTTKTADAIGWCMRNLLEKNPVSLKNLEPVPLATPTSEPIPNIVYRNEKYQFEFNYPANFLTTEDRGQSFLGVKPVIELENTVAIISVSVKPNIKKTECENLYNDHSLIDNIFGGELFRTYSNSSTINGVNYKNKIFRHLKNTTCYEIATSVIQADTEKAHDFYTQFEYIRASFKFTYPEENPANWSLYSNNNGRYSIRYPSGYKLNENKIASVDGVFVDTPGVVQIISPAINKVNFTLAITYQNADSRKLEDIVPQIDSCISKSKGYSSKIGRVEGLTYRDTPCGLWNTTEIFSLKDDLVYIITIETAGTYKDVESAVNKLLVTMEFNSKAEVTSTPTPSNPEGKFCGGFAGVACPAGYNCQLDGNYPDASGKCVKN